MSTPIELHESVRVPRALADCWRYLADFSTVEQWDPSVSRADKLTDGAPRPGTRFCLWLRFAGRELRMDYTLVAARAPAELVLEGQGDGFCVRDHIVLAEGGPQACRIDYRARLTLSSASAARRMLAQALMRRAGRRAVDGIARALTIRREVPELSLADALADRLVLPGMWKFTRAGWLGMPDRGLSEFIDGRVVVVTGPTAGIGLAAAQMLSRLGAHLVLLGRGAERLAEAARAVRAFSGAGEERIECVQADLLSIADTRRAARLIAQRHRRVDVLLNNAGALFTHRCESADGHEASLAVNLIAPWLLTQTLMPALRAARGRVINMASGGLYTQPLRLDDLQYTKAPYNGPKAYARAKRALVALNEHWAAQVAEVDFHAMHPGWVATPGVSKSLPAFERKLQGHLREPRMGADTAVYLASASAVAGVSGRFWFDRRPRATALLPGTAHRPAQADELRRWLEAHAAV